MRNLHSYSIAAALMLAATACNPIAEYTGSEAPKRLVLDGTTVQVDVRFAPGSSGLAAADAARLRGLAATGQIAASDRVFEIKSFRHCEKCFNEVTNIIREQQTTKPRPEYVASTASPAPSHGRLDSIHIRFYTSSLESDFQLLYGQHSR